jgi:Domain of unknown function (DUF4293)
MWQRIQTLFLALTIFAMFAMLFFPIWVLRANGEIVEVLTPLYYEVKSGGTSQVTYFPYSTTAILAMTSMTLAFIALTKYKDRVLQMKLGALNSLVMAGAVVAAVLFVNRLTSVNENGWQYGLGLYIPIGGVFLNFVANRFIRRDEKLVRDSERLR